MNKREIAFVFLDTFRRCVNEYYVLVGLRLRIVQLAHLIDSIRIVLGLLLFLLHHFWLAITMLFCLAAQTSHPIVVERQAGRLLNQTAARQNVVEPEKLALREHKVQQLSNAARGNDLLIIFEITFSEKKKKY